MRCSRGHRYLRKRALSRGGFAVVFPRASNLKYIPGSEDVPREHELIGGREAPFWNCLAQRWCVRFTLAWIMSDAFPVVINLTEKAADVPSGPGNAGSVALLALLCVFAGVLLVLLSVLLLVCRRRLQDSRRYSRASSDPEKSNTTYLEESQLVPDISVQVSASGGHDGETERFLSTASVARRVSFNEAALSDPEETAGQRHRYTLTEGDFHHLKNARLTPTCPRP
ncbi:hypothetical protein AAFF_G00373730 [Aldrovandia affinis]|uniref:Uncharacterized protein n=1 Tax=Aldrovandia affinis TaxID=143900 RepID=A0AAD7R4G2_9TELE|nr:hypothetical protein AAFF_G00373730 [Aldrovandia affinis]